MTHEAVAAIREFNRCYTRHLGLLDEGLLASAFSLTEVRVLYELAQREAPTATELGEALGLDAGYLSRILKRFEASGLITRRRSDADQRRSCLYLTPAGAQAFAPLDEAAAQQVAAAIAPLVGDERTRLLNALAIVRRLLFPAGASRETGTGFSLRAPQAGDIGWAIARHGVLYADEYGWNHEFEGLVARIFGSFLERHDPQRERCWIAERAGERVGCVFLVRHAEHADTAQLRCLLVEPSARGHGVGKALVDACLSFAREAGYRRMVLWTNSVLVSARRLYQAAGFELIEEKPHRSFGHDLVGQIWARDL